MVPWRDSKNKYRKILPLKQGLNENHLRWADFNQEDLTKRDDSFLTMLHYRAKDHPCQFGILDTFRENKFIANNEKLIALGESYIYRPGSVLVTVSSNEDEGDDYGTRYFPADYEEARAVLAAGTWLEEPAAQLMINQRRIYHFLQSAVLRILQLDPVADEETERDWLPDCPDPDDVRTAQYPAQLSTYVDFLRETMHYTSINNNLVLLAFGICFRQTNSYAARLKGIKSSPRLFYNHISDIREHSHHEVVYSLNGEKHRWVSHVNLLCNAKAEPLGANSR